MKKICFVTTISLTLKTFVLKTAEYIHNNTNWEISFICNDDEDFKKILPEYIKYYPIKMERGISISGVKAMFEMKKIFCREKFDLIQYSTPNASLYASLAGWLAHVPVRLYCQWGMAYVGLNGVKRTIFKHIEKTVCHLSTWIEPDSYSNLNFAHDEGLYSKNKGFVIWNGSACGVDLKKFDFSLKEKYRKEVRQQYGIKDDEFIYGFVGRITRDKGINELLESFKKINSGNEFLFLVGPSEVDQTVDQNLYNWARNSKNVIFAGYTNTVEKYLSAMDCYILPSYREGFGMGVVEAGAMGVPVIVTDIPGPIDAMQNKVTGLIVDKKDVEGLTKAMKMISGNPDMYKKFGAAGKEFARTRFEQNTFLENILEDRKRLLK